jgi:hypothetical protein
MLYLQKYKNWEVVAQGRVRLCTVILTSGIVETSLIYDYSSAS